MADRSSAPGVGGKNEPWLTPEADAFRAEIKDFGDRLAALSHWLEGSEAQRRVGLAQWGVLCAVCADERDAK